ncbi:PREDICTED: uncharacterized protein LOC106120029 isoform X1 [Papilio xuthus]|uniref:Uncharacterized protein LOC106120029 isoform X1 n=1 Tax=Papilio xuthus TaxID=66420 RepID=A0AAJ6ZE98_PAPXU|nr:PREDICTED: uncharacterized protein LOC106120029 isoform X1 [Papilio xuthus]
MAGKLVLFVFLTVIALSHGEAQNNYETSRVKVPTGIGFSQILDYLLGGYGNGHYPERYPGGYYPGGGYQGQYPGYHPGVVGPPGAHPGCPLCDSSVYSYCSYKQAHDACCCEHSGFMSFHCHSTNCNFVYANSCEEYHLITNCCCVDVQRSALPNVVV